ncbi:MAG TPA: hypothetical protein VH593_06580 [Ktedonobacteraceae bacterium]
MDKFKTLSGWEFEVVQQREEPDFILKMPSGNLMGLEVRMLFKDEADRGGSPNKKREHQRNSFLQRLARQYYNEGGLPARVEVLLPRSVQLTDDWIEKLSELLRVNRPKMVSERTRFEINLGRAGIAKIFVKALPDEFGNYGWWVSVNNFVGLERSLTRAILAQTITEKSTRLASYRKAVKKTMLLIVAEGTQESGMFEYKPRKTLLPKRGFAEVHLLIHPLEVHRIA